MYYNVPEECGIYAVMKLDGFLFQLLDVPQGPKTYRGKEIPRPDKRFEDVSQKYLYIGKSATSLKIRLKQFISFGYATNDTSMGHNSGSNLWFVNNNKNFFLGYITEENIKKIAGDLLYKPAVEVYNQICKKKTTDIPEVISTGLLELHKMAYNGLFPFALRENDVYVNELKQFWQEYWTKVVEKKK